MTDPKTIPLQPITTNTDVPLEGESTLTIENPDAPVNLEGFKEVDGVEEGIGLEDQFNIIGEKK